MEESASEQPAQFVTEFADEPHPVSRRRQYRCYAPGPIQTSTPTRCHVSDREKPYRQKNNSGDSSDCSSPVTGVSVIETGDNALQRDNEDFVPFKIPILGYETIEEREKFTVFKLEVCKSSYESWFIFRRYSDFGRLKRQLKRIYPDVHLMLPPKKWFGGKFETTFLDERMAGLQNFVDRVLSNKEINSSDQVKQFFCCDEPPGPYESLEESRALCESLEDQIYRLTVQLQERDEKIKRLETELKVGNEKFAELKQGSYSSCACISELQTRQDVNSNENLKHECCS